MIIFYGFIGMFALIGLALCATLLFLKMQRIDWTGGVAGIEDEIEYIMEEDRIYKEELKIFFDALSDDQKELIPFQLKGQIEYALKTPEEIEANRIADEKNGKRASKKQKNRKKTWTYFSSSPIIHTSTKG